MARKGTVLVAMAALCWGISGGIAGVPGLSYAVFIFGFKYAAPHGTPQAILVIAFAALVTVFTWLVEANQVMAVFRSQSWPLFMLLGVFGAGLSFTPVYYRPEPYRAICRFGGGNG